MTQYKISCLSIASWKKSRSDHREASDQTNIIILPYKKRRVWFSVFTSLASSNHNFLLINQSFTADFPDVKMVFIPESSKFSWWMSAGGVLGLHCLTASDMALQGEDGEDKIKKKFKILWNIFTYQRYDSDLMCPGVVPQQPPTIFTSPSWAKSCQQKLT